MHTRYGHFVLYLCLVLAALSISSFAGAADEVVNAPWRFKSAGGEVPEWSTKDAKERPENGNYGVSWEYPVFVGEPTARLRKLNGWTRNVSLNSLFQVESPKLRQALAMKDSGVLNALNKNTAFRNDVGTQAALKPTHVFGPYIVFTLYTEWLGAARPHHGITTLVYDYKAGKMIPIESLFKPDAEEELAALLRSAIEETFREDKLSYAACQQRRPQEQQAICKRTLSDDDVDSCVNWRSFEWHLLSIENSQALSIQFPHNPREHLICGDSAYWLEASAISRLLKSPIMFERRREVEKVK